MAKVMAKLENGVVVNILWCQDTQPETDTLKSPMGRPVGVGDTYENGIFYRDGVEVLNPLEEAQRLIVQYEAALREIDEALEVEA